MGCMAHLDMVSYRHLAASEAYVEGLRYLEDKHIPGPIDFTDIAALAFAAVAFVAASPLSPLSWP